MFSSDHTGLCEFRPTQCIGDGHAMGWNAGAEFTMMEKSVRTEFSAAGRSYPPYGTGNNHNTWYGASIIDSTGKEIPYADRDGNILDSIEKRFLPVKGQPFFLKGGSIDNPKYEYEGPETLPFSKMIEKGYKLPFYADLTSLPETERKVIWGMMVGEEGKTRVPIYENYKNAGFDPEKHVLQCYGTGWTSASFLPQERQLFGLPGGFLNDWELKTNIEGLYVAGDSLYASNCYGHAAATGYYAGRHASKYALKTNIVQFDQKQGDAEKRRIYAPLKNNPETAIGWKELNMGISKIMQNYCGDVKRDELLNMGLLRLKEYEKEVIPNVYAYNPHELVRLLEVFDILTVSQIILHSCIVRKTSSKSLCFNRGDSDTDELNKDKRLITVKLVNNTVVIDEKPLAFFGNLKENYEKYNQDYIGGK
jgi:succinate dehydrogenase/fumarate reductase flavoprotein subunit